MYYSVGREAPQERQSADNNGKVEYGRRHKTAVSFSDARSRRNSNACLLRCRSVDKRAYATWSQVRAGSNQKSWTADIHHTEDMNHDSSAAYYALSYTIIHNLSIVYIADLSCPSSTPLSTALLSLYSCTTFFLFPPTFSPPSGLSYAYSRPTVFLSSFSSMPWYASPALYP